MDRFAEGEAEVTELQPNESAIYPIPPSEAEASAVVQVDCVPPASESPSAPPPAEAESLPIPDPDVRARLLGQFEQWLDRMLAGEPAPEGIPRELLGEIESIGSGYEPRGEEPDLYTLFSALTTLSGEIRLQGRAFKQLTEAIVPLSALPSGIEQLYSLQQDSADRLDQLADQMQRPAQELAESFLPPPKQMLAVLMDLYDRMKRGEQTLKSASQSIQAQAPRGWRRWLGGAKNRDAAQSLASVLEGQALTITRLKDAFNEWGVERIGRVGESFDPARMTAIEIGRADGVAQGTVLDVYRTGYAVRGFVLATAQVKVARNEVQEADHG